MIRSTDRAIFRPLHPRLCCSIEWTLIGVFLFSGFVFIACASEEEVIKAMVRAAIGDELKTVQYLSAGVMTLCISAMAWMFRQGFKFVEKSKVTEQAYALELARFNQHLGDLIGVFGGKACVASDPDVQRVLVALRQEQAARDEKMRLQIKMEGA